MNFFSKLFGGKKPQNNSSNTQASQNKSADNYSDWQKKEQERQAALAENVKAPIIQHISKNGIFKFTIEAGNDEAFLHFEASTEKTEEDEQELYDIEEYLIDVLDIPSAGEFSMTGEGSLFMKNNKVYCEYKTIYKELLDYDEENDKEIYSDETEERYETELFPL
ncbi:MAG TPA: hypothetical protein VD905_12235 [Flavobacteriales bacterium]|nr:hypothetical protein [Flavobacteriales bacterium]